MKEKDPFVQHVNSLPTVSAFLKKIEQKGSWKTAKTYRSALVHLQKNLQPKYDCETVIDAIKDKKVDEYKLLNDYIAYLQDNVNGITNGSIGGYDTGIKSYLGFNDIFIIPQKFKFKVGLPKNHVEDEEPIEKSDVRKLLNGCTNLRLKAYLYVLATSGTRAKETLSLRYKDLTEGVPTKLTFRAQFTKTGKERFSYVTEEASKCLNEWLQFKNTHREYFIKDKVTKKTVKHIKKDITEEDLIFSANDTIDLSKMEKATERKKATDRIINNMYTRLDADFITLLEKLKMDAKKESGIDGRHRHKITLHSFRRFVMTTVAGIVNSDYSNWLIGHKKSTYWVAKEAMKAELYLKCKSELTFQDYEAIEATGKDNESRLDQKDQEIAMLKDKIENMKKDITPMIDARLIQVLKAEPNEGPDSVIKRFLKGKIDYVKDKYVAVEDKEKTTVYRTKKTK